MSATALVRVNRGSTWMIFAPCSTFAEAVYFLTKGSGATAMGDAADPFQPTVIPFNVGVIACGFVLTLCANCFSFSFHAYQSELYPTRIRAQAIGFVYSWSRFSAIFSGFIIAYFLGNYGTIGVFGLIASAMIAVFIVIGFFGPPVTRRRLEAIAA